MYSITKIDNKPIPENNEIICFNLEEKFLKGAIKLNSNKYLLFLMEQEDKEPLRDHALLAQREPFAGGLFFPEASPYADIDTEERTYAEAAIHYDPIPVTFEPHDEEHLRLSFGKSDNPKHQAYWCISEEFQEYLPQMARLLALDPESSLRDFLYRNPQRYKKLFPEDLSCEGHIPAVLRRLAQEDINYLNKIWNKPTYSASMQIIDFSPDYTGAKAGLTSLSPFSEEEIDTKEKALKIYHRVRDSDFINDMPFDTFKCLFDESLLTIEKEA